MNEELMKFVSQQKYLSEVPFVFGRSIFEYDIKQANIHALLAAGKISMDEFRFLSLAPKQLREVEIGNKIKNNPEMYQDIQNVICQAKYEFMSQNGIQVPQVLRIANDSLYIQTPINNYDPIVKINDVPIEFVMKNHFMNYMQLTNQILLFCNTDGNYWNIDIKGIKNSKHYLHQDFISALCDIIDARNNGGKEIAITEFNKIYNAYITYSLPVGYYRELNSDSLFKIKGDTGFSISGSDSLKAEQVDYSFNLMILRTVYSYLLQS